jgi:hypothetical protein
MEQKPGDQEAKGSNVGHLWPLALGVGTAVGAGIDAAIGSTAQARKQVRGLLLQLDLCRTDGSAAVPTTT